MTGWDLDTYESWINGIWTRLSAPPGSSVPPPNR
jgi:hypothetical protein